MEPKEIIEKVIKSESSLIGPVAIRKADEVDGISVDSDGKVESLERDGEDVLEEILESYKTIVGEQAIKATKRDVKEDIEGDVPESLQ